MASGFGHIPPAAERKQLRKEIDGLVKSVEKAVANPKLKTDERLRLVETMKAEINDKKCRVATLKQVMREEKEAAAEKEAAPAAKELAPVKPPTSPRPAPSSKPLRPNAKEPWQRPIPKGGALSP